MTRRVHQADKGNFVRLIISVNNGIGTGLPAPWLSRGRVFLDRPLWSLARVGATGGLAMDDLQYLNGIWNRLRSMADGSAPSAAIQIATVSSTGSPGLRTVIVREASFEEATVSFITDIRSTKIKDIRRDPRVSAISYELESRVQIKLAGTAAIVDDKDARHAVWERLKPHSRKQFERDLPSGISLYSSDGTPMGWEDDGASPKEPYDRFALVSISVTSAEWLDVSTEDHTRYAFYRDRQPKWRSIRLSP